MGWVELFIRRHILTWMLMVALVLFGIISVQKMGISEFPDVDFPVVDITVSWEGANPELVEKQLADPIENAISSVQGITAIYTVARSNGVSVTAEFELNTPIDTAVQDIQVALARIQRQFPREVDPPVVRKTNPEDRPIIWVSVVSDTLSRADLMAKVRDQIRPRFTTIPGVASVQMGGYVDPAILIQPNLHRMSQLQLSLQDIGSSLQTEHIELPAGPLESRKKDLAVRVMGEAETMDAIKQLPITRRGGGLNYRPIQLQDIATVSKGLAHERSIARSMGKGAIALGFNKQRGSNAVEVGDAIKRQVAAMQSDPNRDIQMGITFDSTTFIRASIHDLLLTLVASAVLTTAVCWVFLGSWSATFNVALAIPTAIFGSFIVMNMLGFTLNTFTLLGLSMAIGVVVDDAIMILENITRHQQMGKPAMQAAQDGTHEIMVATIAASSVLASLFLPVVLLDGILGHYLSQFGLTVCAAVAFSFVEAVTLTPMRLARFHHAPSHHIITQGVSRQMKQWGNRYQTLLEWLLHPRYYRRRTMGVLGSALLILGLGGWAGYHVHRELTPYQDTNRMVIMMRGRLGTPLPTMDRAFKQIESMLMKDPSIDRYIGFVGGNQVNSGRIIIQLHSPDKRPNNPRTNRPYTQQEIADGYRSSLKSVRGVRIMVQDAANRAFPDRRGFPIDLGISGPDWKTVVSISQTLQNQLNQSLLFKDVDSDYREGLPEIRLIPNRILAQQHGVSITDIGKTIQSGLSGMIIGQFSDQMRTDIRLRLAIQDRDNINSILQLPVRNSRGELLPISKLVNVIPTRTIQEINRENKRRMISITANLHDGVSQSDAVNTAHQLAKPLLPSGYQLKIGGVGQATTETTQQFIWVLFIGITCSAMVLASLFNHIRLASVVLIAIPFSISGSLISLVLTNQNLHIFSGIGVLLSVGLVLKNAIMMVEMTTNQFNKGTPWHESIITACPIRLRPIIMTSLATIIGAIPAAIMSGPGSETRIPLAISVIGGVLTSTLVSLVLVPTLLSWIKND